MSRRLLDASALLAYMNGEPGAEAVGQAIAEGAEISAINLAEVYSKTARDGLPSADLDEALRVLGIRVIDLGADIAVSAGTRHGTLHRQGSSLADVVCLETARALGATALTADRAWGALGDEVEVIR